MQTSLSQRALIAKNAGLALNYNQLYAIVAAIADGTFDKEQTKAYLIACRDHALNSQEIIDLTSAMCCAGECLSWGERLVVDKHCVGGLPGNRTTPIVTSIIAANGLLMPKTSSRAITSPAGTADTMEVLTKVDLSIDQMKAVVEKEGACFIWGGALSLSPADDAIIRVQRELKIENIGQMVASILSKKISAGSTHILIDIPVGPTAKFKSIEQADALSELLQSTANALGVNVFTVQSEGFAPVGEGVGPALEARDILSVLQNNGPSDLTQRALALAGKLLEMGGVVKTGQGLALALETLESGRAWDKFVTICDAQGGFYKPKPAKYVDVVKAKQSGLLSAFDCQRIAQAAKLAGAPKIKEAGLDMHVQLNAIVKAGQPLFSIHANDTDQLQAALAYTQSNPLLELSSN